MSKLVYGPPLKRGLAVILALVLCSTSCTALPSEVQREIERVFQGQAEQFVEMLKREAQTALDDYREELTGRLEEAWEDSTHRAKRFLGLEAPSDVGYLSIGISTETSRTVIERAFQDTYMKAGGGRVIGWPEDVVRYWDQSTPELLVQYFSGGSERRSAIVMRDGEEAAYELPGEWLAVYEALGGPSLAGYPASSPETWTTNPVWQVWLTWGRGKLQRFRNSSGEYALMQPRGLETVHVVPPDLWAAYEEEAATQIGYPLSSYPLDDWRWKEQSGIPSETRAILNRWKEQPFRVQVYENGSLMWRDGGDVVEVVEYGRGVSFMSLGTVTLLQGARRELGSLWLDSSAAGHGHTCFAKTIRHGANMAASASGDKLIPQVALLPVRSTLVGADLKVGSLLGEFSLSAARVLVDLAGGDELGEAAGYAVVGQVIDAIYTKSVGDIATVPLKEATMIVLKEEVARLSRGRIAEESSLQLGERYGRFQADMNAQLNIEYDPLTRTLTGVIVSDCAPKGIAFFYRVDLSTGHKSDATQVWDGRVHFIDLATGETLP